MFKCSFVQVSNNCLHNNGADRFPLEDGAEAELFAEIHRNVDIHPARFLFLGLAPHTSGRHLHRLCDRDMWLIFGNP